MSDSIETGPKRYCDVREDSLYSLHIRFIPTDQGGPLHQITMTCERCGTSWNAKQRKILQQDNCTNLAVNHRLECPGLNQE